MVNNFWALRREITDNNDNTRHVHPGTQTRNNHQSENGLLTTAQTMQQRPQNYNLMGVNNFNQERYHMNNSVDATALSMTNFPFSANDSRSFMTVARYGRALPLGSGLTSIPQQHRALPLGSGLTSSHQQHQAMPLGSGLTSSAQQHMRALPLGSGLTSSPQQHQALPLGSGLTSSHQQHRALPLGSGLTSSHQQHMRALPLGSGLTSSPQQHQALPLGSGITSSHQQHRALPLGSGITSIPQQHMRQQHRALPLGLGLTSSPQQHRALPLGSGLTSSHQQHRALPLGSGLTSSHQQHRALPLGSGLTSSSQQHMSSSNVDGSQASANWSQNPSRPIFQNQRNSRYLPYGEGSIRRNNYHLSNNFNLRPSGNTNRFHNVNDGSIPSETRPPFHPINNNDLSILSSGNANWDSTRDTSTSHRVFNIRDSEARNRSMIPPNNGSEAIQTETKELLLFKDTIPTSPVTEADDANENDDNEHLDLLLHL
ncbi:hypothetical protein MTR_5g090540 [Medicago truncatula]|uniref:Uncharacterized protein n=1 Tax=Medicago truncatula TaxID=3880 RepID=G7K373_MEDTR|nr:hypothetical protein MTR_5g090540 [Medicago truncatula]